jgi:hypothetical protein
MAITGFLQAFHARPVWVAIPKAELLLLVLHRKRKKQNKLLFVCYSITMLLTWYRVLTFHSRNDLPVTRSHSMIGPKFSK